MKTRLGDQVEKFKMEGKVVYCGDFKATCGGLSDMVGERRCSVVWMKISQGEVGYRIVLVWDMIRRWCGTECIICS